MSVITFFLVMIVTVALFAVSTSLLARGIMKMLRSAVSHSKKRSVETVMPIQLSNNTVEGEWLSRKPVAPEMPRGFLQSAPIDGQIVRKALCH